MLFKTRKSDLYVCLFITVAVILASIFAGPFTQKLLIEMMVFAILAMSLDLLLGYTGLLSIGHAVYFGISGIVATVLFIDFSWPLLLAIAGAILLTMFVAFITALACCKFSGIQFTMLTLAFGQLLWTLFINSRTYTGGHDGRVVSKPLRIEIADWMIDFRNPLTLMMITALLLIVFYLFMRKLTQSPFGKLLLSVKENENRAVFLGYNTYRVKVQIFMIASLFSSIAGILFFMLKAFVISDNMNWVVSGDILLMTLVGGTGTIFGPLLGAAFFVWVKDALSSYTENWHLYLGILFIVVVMYLSKGVFGWLGSSKKPQ